MTRLAALAVIIAARATLVQNWPATPDLSKLTAHQVLSITDGDTIRVQIGGKSKADGSPAMGEVMT